jgi:hypothetical protein
VPVIAGSAFSARALPPRAAPVRVLLSIPLVLLLVPGWTGDARLPLLGDSAEVAAERVALDSQAPGRTRLGGLTFLGGVALTSPDRAFGGFSALALAGDRFTLLSDGGNVVEFRMGADWRPRDVRFGALPGGPGTGWRKSDRDSESLARDPRTGRLWVGFERANAIGRFAPGFARAEAFARPRAMRRWPENGGAETLARLADGRFVAISESRRPKVDRSAREGVIFAGDPVAGPAGVERFAYRPAPGYDPVDAAELPDGRLIVLERRFRFPFRWYNRLALVPRGAVRAGATVRGRELARLAAPVLHDNFEGVVAVRQGTATVIWLVSDDNQSSLQRTLLLKFRLDR